MLIGVTCEGSPPNEREVVKEEELGVDFGFDDDDDEG